MRNFLGTTANSNGCDRVPVAKMSRLKWFRPVLRTPAEMCREAIGVVPSYSEDNGKVLKIMEREMGLEPTTFSLGTCASFGNKELLRPWRKS